MAALALAALAGFVLGIIAGVVDTFVWAWIGAPETGR